MNHKFAEGYGQKLAGSIETFVDPTLDTTSAEVTGILAMLTIYLLLQKQIASFDSEARKAGVVVKFNSEFSSLRSTAIEIHHIVLSSKCSFDENGLLLGRGHDMGINDSFTHSRQPYRIYKCEVIVDDK